MQGKKSRKKKANIPQDTRSAGRGGGMRKGEGRTTSHVYQGIGGKETYHMEVFNYILPWLSLTKTEASRFTFHIRTQDAAFIIVRIVYFLWNFRSTQTLIE